jgi:hypothetical protein
MTQWYLNKINKFMKVKGEYKGCGRGMDKEERGRGIRKNNRRGE